MKLKIHILEDNPDIGFILQTVLEDEGYEVTTFATVKDFQTAAEAQVPDLFLLDVMLPDGDGISVCTQIKTNQKTNRIPVVMMSAHYPADSLDSLTGANGFIAKPFDIDHVSKYLNKLLTA